MPGWVLPYQDLTQEQRDVVELPMSQHRVVLGPPGSGKTQVLLHRAAFLAQKHKVPVDQFQVFLYTNVLKEYIRSGLSDLCLPPENVNTLDSWCCQFYEDQIGLLPRVTRAGKPDFERVRREVMERFKQRKHEPFFDFVVVDEGQDLSETGFQILRLIARHITVFADDQQQIYEDGATTAGIFRCLSISPASRTLLSAYRNSPSVARLASYFIDDPSAREQYLARQHKRIEGRDKPLLYAAWDFEEEMDRLAEVVSERERLNQRVGIIVPKNNLVHGYARGLEERGVKVERVVSRYESKNSNYDFQAVSPKILNIYNAKGLTFDVVVLPRLRNSAFREQIEPAMRRRLLFVAISRAMEWVYLSKTEGDPLEEDVILHEAHEHGDLYCQTKKDRIDRSVADTRLDENLPF